MPDSLKVSLRGAFSHAWNECIDSNTSCAVRLKKSLVALVTAFFSEYTVRTVDVSSAFLENGDHENSIFAKEYRTFKSMNTESVKQEPVEEKEKPANEQVDTNAESNNFYKQDAEKAKKNDLTEGSNRASVVNISAKDIEKAMDNLYFDINDDRFSVENINSLAPKDCLHLLRKAYTLNNGKLALRFLLTEKCNLPDDERKTLLFFFANQSLTRGVEFLLDSSAENMVNCKNDHGTTLLTMATLVSCLECMEMLLKKGATVDYTDSKGNLALHTAAAMGNEECLNVLLEHGAGKQINALNKRGLTPLCRAASAGKIGCLKTLLKIDAALVNGVEGKNSPLNLAAANGHLECLTELLNDDNIDVNHKNAHGETPIHDALNNRHIACFSALLNTKGIDYNGTNSRGETLLHVAIATEQEECFNQLLAKEHIQVNLVGQHNSTPLHYAAETEHTWALNALLARTDIQLNLVNKDGHTPLQYAISFGQKKPTMILLKTNNIPFNVMDNKNNTLLHSIAEWGNEECLKALLSIAPNILNYVHNKNNNGQTPLECAEKGQSKGHKLCATLLRDGA